MIKKLFKPKMYIQNYTQLNLSKVKASGIELILFDIDNTLVAHDEKYPDSTVKAYLEQVQAEGFQVALISNNTKLRVETFAEQLGVNAYYFSKKPMKLTYKKILSDYKIEPKRVLAVGDQLLTDVLGANRMGINVVLCAPLVTKDLSFTKINRLVEQVVYFALAKLNHLKKGEFYD